MQNATSIKAQVRKKPSTNNAIKNWRVNYKEKWQKKQPTQRKNICPQWKLIPQFGHKLWKTVWYWTSKEKRQDFSNELLSLNYVVDSIIFKISKYIIYGVQ